MSSEAHNTDVLDNVEIDLSYGCSSEAHNTDVLDNVEIDLEERHDKCSEDAAVRR